MWAIFKVFTEFVKILFVFSVLVFCFLLFILLGIACSAHAICPLPRDVTQSLDNAQVRFVYKNCAEGYIIDYNI